MCYQIFIYQPIESLTRFSLGNRVPPGGSCNKQNSVNDSNYYSTTLQFCHLWRHLYYNREWPGRHFLPGSKSEYVDVPFAGSEYETGIVCLHVKKLVMAWVPGLLGAHIFLGSHIDNRLQCTVSWISLNGFDKKCLVLTEAVRRRANL